MKEFLKRLYSVQHFELMFFCLFLLTFQSCKEDECGVNFSSAEEDFIGEGEAFQAQESYNKAIKLYDKAIRLNANNYVARSNRAICLFKKEGINQSKVAIGEMLDELEFAIDVCPDFRPAYTNIISISNEFGVSFLTIDYGREFIARFGESCYVNSMLAQAYFNVGDTARVAHMSDYLLNMPCNYGNGALTVARYQMKVGKYDSAKQILLDLINTNKGYYLTHRYLGQLYLALEENTSAKASFLQAMLLNREDFDSAYELAKIFVEEGDLKEACDYLNSAYRNSSQVIRFREQRLEVQKLIQTICNQK